MRILGIDLETTGLVDPEITEIGAILMGYDQGNYTLLQTFGRIMSGEKKIEEAAEKITGITNEIRTYFGVDFGYIRRGLYRLFEEADYIIGHNAIDFDKRIIETEFERHNMTTDEFIWLDTMYDVPYPDHIRHMSLINLAAMHGHVNLFHHRALFDVAVMFKILEHYEFSAIAERGKYPFISVVAAVNYSNRELAKNLRYRWYSISQVWLKRIRECDLLKETELTTNAGFQISNLDIDWEHFVKLNNA